LNRALQVTGIVLCLYETGTRLASDIVDDLTDVLRRSTPDTPWANAKIFSGRIRRNVRLAESPGYGQSIFDYAPKSSGAADYSQLIEEVLAMEADQSQSRAAA